MNGAFIMKKLVLFFLFLYMATPLYAGEALSPQRVVENFLEFFNNEDRASLNALWGNPIVYVRGGKPAVYSDYGDAVDFDGIKASGWSYSRFHKNELIYQDDISAMVLINLSRYNKDDVLISNADVVYLLIMRGGSWKLKGAFIDGNLTTGRD